jgi:hypothetical protein
MNITLCICADKRVIFSVADPMLLNRLARDVQQNYAGDIQFPFIPLYLVIATWSNVTFKGSNSKNIVGTCSYELKIA